jgi:hypothetical protein
VIKAGESKICACAVPGVKRATRFDSGKAVVATRWPKSGSGARWPDLVIASVSIVARQVRAVAVHLPNKIMVGAYQR